MGVKKHRWGGKKSIGYINTSYTHQKKRKNSSNCISSTDLLWECQPIIHVFSHNLRNKLKSVWYPWVWDQSPNFSRNWSSLTTEKEELLKLPSTALICYGSANPLFTCSRVNLRKQSQKRLKICAKRPVSLPFHCFSLPIRLHSRKVKYINQLEAENSAKTVRLILGPDVDFTTDKTRLDNRASIPDL